LNHRVGVYQLKNTSVDDSLLTLPAQAGAGPDNQTPGTNK